MLHLQTLKMWFLLSSGWMMSYRSRYASSVLFCLICSQGVLLLYMCVNGHGSWRIDERAVLKHFNCPEQKADALREAAFEYCDLKKLESEASSFKDSTRQTCGHALKKMQALAEKLEHGVYNLSRLQESAAKTDL